MAEEMSSLERKQAYFRDNILREQFDDFYEYCEEEVGNVDIEGWSLEYVQELVTKFKEQEAMKLFSGLVKKQSFFSYQTSNQQDVQELSNAVKREQQRTPPKQEKIAQSSSGQKGGALKVLDEIFESKPGIKSNEYNSRKYDQSFFESKNFWDVPGSSNAIEATPQKAKPSAPPYQHAPNPYSQQKEKRQSQRPTPQKQGHGYSTSKNPKQPLIKYQGQILFGKPFSQQLKCFKSFERTALSSKQLKVSIVDHEIIQRSFFSSNYPMFHVRVMPASITCKRNLEDFIKLRSNLQAVYPGVRLPFVDKAGLFESETDPGYIERQKKYLTFFLDDVLAHPELKNSRIMEDFLTLRDHKMMKRKFEEYDKISRVTALQQLCLLEGAVSIQLNEHTRQYNQYLADFRDKFQTYWNQQERLISEINSLQRDLVERCNRLTEATKEMQQAVKQFNKKVAICELEFLGDSLENYRKYFNEVGQHSQHEAEFLEERVLPVMRYEKENMQMLGGLVGAQGQLTRQYVRRRKEEKETMDYSDERLKECKVGVLQESKSITVLKYQCGYANSLLAEEAHLYLRLLADKLKYVVSDVSYAKLDQLSKEVNGFTDLVFS